MRERSVAVVGAGLCGLAVSYFLAKKGAQVTLYEKRKVGGGASGIAAGLLHPYPGKYKRLSWKGHEALAKTIFLLDEVERFLGKKVANRDGIAILTRTRREEKFLEEHRAAFADVEKRGDGEYWIKSGITIDAPLYLEGLAHLCRSEGVQIIYREILPDDSFPELILACGSESPDFTSLDEFEKVGGQVLLGRQQGIGIVSIVGDGYIAHVSGEAFIVGATYDRDIAHLPETPSQELIEKAKPLARGHPFEIEGCRSGIRLCRKEGYLPLVGPAGPHRWIFTGMGSRGLLYHAYFGEQLADQVLGDSL